MNKPKGNERKALRRVRCSALVRPLHRDHKLMLRSLGANIKDARLKTGISMRMMAKLSGVSKGNCSKIERGGNVTALGLYKLCWSIGVHPRDVLPEYRPNDGTQRPGDAEATNATRATPPGSLK